MKEKKKILFAEKELLHYRIPFYTALAKKVGKLTVCHSGKPIKLDEKVCFDQIILPTKKIKRFVFQKGLWRLAKQYDVVITKFDISWLSMIFLSSNPFRKYKVYHWGIGVSSAKGWDTSQKFDWLRVYHAKKSDGIILYSDKPVEKYLLKINPEKIHVGHNTVEVKLDNYAKKEGRYFLFVGSIDKRKNLEEVIQAMELMQKKGLDISLKIIGKGKHTQQLKSLVEELKVNGVEFTGPKYKEQLTEYFSNAIATISPNQAGLTVLESTAHGVPFITKRQVITGGEQFNIEENINGILYSGNEYKLAQVMEKILTDKSFQQHLSNNAFHHYHEKRRMDHLVDIFYKIIHQ